MFKFTSKGVDYQLDIENNVLYDNESAYELSTRSIQPSKTAYLKFSSECNLNCVYCFQKYDKNAHNRRLIDRVDDMLNDMLANCDEVILFGGEPLLDKNLEVIEKVLDYVKVAVKPITVAAFTNGCHSSIFSDLLIANRYVISNLVITIDGPKMIHDRRRILKGGSSFDLIFSNLKSYLKHGISFSISVVVDQSNIYYLDDLFIELNKLGQTYNTRISVTLIEGKHYSNSLEEIDILKSYLEFKQKYNMLFFETSFHIVDKLKRYLSNEGVSSRVCDAGVTKVYDFETGHIYTCPHTIDSVIGMFNEVEINIASKEVEETNAQIDKEKNATCSKCEFKYLCDYGCPYSSKIDYKECRKRNVNILSFILKNFDLIYEL